ncbi:DMT family transporter [Rhodobacteraceae bacterium NNCM2]|nr:DMT family transporter [Coraliihabitans acroporae]
MAMHIWGTFRAITHQPGTARPDALGYGLGVLTWMLAGSIFVVVKAVADEVPPYTLGFFRMAILVLILFPIVARHRQQMAALLRERGIEVLVIGAIGLGLTQAAIYAAVQMTSAVNVSVIFGLTPMVTLIFARFLLGEPMSGRQAAGALVAFAGVVVIVVKGRLTNLLGLEFGAGELVAFAAALMMASYTVLLKRAAFTLPPMALLELLALGGAAALFPLFLWEYSLGLHAHLDLRGCLAILYCAVIGGGFMYLCYNWSVEILGAGRAGALVYTQMVFVTIFAWIFLGERLEWYHYLGALFIAAGIVLVLLRRREAA